MINLTPVLAKFEATGSLLVEIEGGYETYACSTDEKMQEIVRYLRRRGFELFLV